MDIAATVDSMREAGIFCSCETCRKLQIEWGERIAAESRRQAETERGEARAALKECESEREEAVKQWHDWHSAAEEARSQRNTLRAALERELEFETFHGGPNSTRAREIRAALDRALGKDRDRG